MFTPVIFAGALPVFDLTYVAVIMFVLIQVYVRVMLVSAGVACVG